jgi:hypothetical protein
MEKELIKFEQYVALLKKEQKDSLYYYTTNDAYKIINEKMRTGQTLTLNSKQHMNNIMNAFDGGPTLDTVLTVYRGMNKPYNTLENKGGVISTSLSKQSAKSFKGTSCCLYIITLTPGEYTILPLMSITELPEEEEILLPPGSLSIQKVIPYTDPTNTENVDIVYCTYIPENAKIINSNKLNNLNNKEFDKVKIKLSLESWINRILDSGIKDEITTFCEDDSFSFNECILEQIKTLEFYDDIPKEAIDKCLLLLNNVSEHLI